MTTKLGSNVVVVDIVLSSVISISGVVLDGAPFPTGLSLPTGTVNTPAALIEGSSVLYLWWFPFRQL